MRGRVLVTGGAGFIGAATVRLLCAEGVPVRVLDDLSSGSAAALPPGVELLRADVRDAAAVAAALRGVEAVLHLAGRSGVERCAADPALAFEVNVTGTRTVLEASRGAVSRLVLASSAAVHGAPVAGPFGVYAATRRAVESLAETRYAPQQRVLRYFNVYGPGQRLRGADAPVLARFLEAAAAGRPLRVEGDGHQRRDFVHVDDVAAANVAALLRPASPGGGPKSAILEIGTGQGTSILELARSLGLALGITLSIEHRPGRPGDQPHSVASPSAAMSQLDWAPRVSLLDGLRALVAAQASAPVNLGLPCMLP